VGWNPTKKYFYQNGGGFEGTIFLPMPTLLMAVFPASAILTCPQNAVLARSR